MKESECRVYPQANQPFKKKHSLKHLVPCKILHEAITYTQLPDMLFVPLNVEAITYIYDQIISLDWYYLYS